MSPTAKSRLSFYLLLLLTLYAAMAGAGSPQVSRRLLAALMDLRRVALPERIAVLDEQAKLLRTATLEAMHDERDIRFALDPDRAALGTAAPYAP